MHITKVTKDVGLEEQRSKGWLLDGIETRNSQKHVPEKVTSAEYQQNSIEEKNHSKSMSSHGRKWLKYGTRHHQQKGR